MLSPFLLNSLAKIMGIKWKFRKKKTLLCLLSTMWHLVQQESGAEGLQGSAWIHSWKKGQQSLCCSTTEDLAYGNFKLQAAVESRDELGTQLSVLSLRPLSETWRWPGGGMFWPGKAPLQCLILLNYILSFLSFLCLPVSSYSLLSQMLLLGGEKKKKGLFYVFFFI